MGLTEGGHGNRAGKESPQRAWARDSKAGEGGTLAEGSGGFGVAARFAPTRASVSPSVITLGPCTAWHCPLCGSVPPCLAIALSPARVGATRPRHCPQRTLVPPCPSPSCLSLYPQHGSVPMCPILGAVPSPAWGTVPSPAWCHHAWEMLVPPRQLLLLPWSCLHPYCLCAFLFYFFL